MPPRSSRPRALVGNHQASQPVRPAVPLTAAAASCWWLLLPATAHWLAGLHVGGCLGEDPLPSLQNPMLHRHRADAAAAGGSAYSWAEAPQGSAHANRSSRTLIVRPSIWLLFILSHADCASSLE
jgi:hypothetical protein